MALSGREKTLMGGLLAFAIFILMGFFVAKPMFEGISKKYSRIGTLDNEIEGVNNLIAIKKEEKLRFSKIAPIPKGYKVRAYENFGQVEENIKIMIDQLATHATNTGNQFISLAKYVATQPQPSVEVTTAESNGDNEDQPIPELERIPLNAYGYEIAVRGNYDNIMGFLSMLNDHKELIEIENVHLENESGPERSTKTITDNFDPLKPIKLTLKLKLYLQQKL